MKKNNSEDTQGARLSKAQDLSLHIQNFVNFNPPHDSDQASNFAAAVEEFEDSVISFALAEQAYRLATEQREKIFHSNDFSALKVLTYIRAIADVYFGKESRQVAIIVGSIKELRGTVTKKKEKATEEEEEADDAVADTVATDETTESEDKPEGKEEPRKVSQSHRSYASMALTFHKIVELLGTISYQSNTPQLQIGALRQLAQQLSQANREVAQSAALKEHTRRTRNRLDEEVGLSVARIKGYVKYAYGVGSVEYLTVK